jgi:hypothetical protein
MDVRRAKAGELEQIIELQSARNGPECGPLIAGLVEDVDHGIDCFTVAVEGNRVVSSLCLLQRSLTIEGVTVGMGQPEFVATSPDHGRRGLVRAQLDLVHEWSADRGDLVQVIAGIPYFYRQFGYEYAVDMPRVRLLLPGVPLDPPAGWEVRRATDADVPAIMALQASTQELSTLVSARSESWWRWSVNSDVGGHDVVATRDGVVHGSAFLGDGPPGVGAGVLTLLTVAADEPDAVWALVAHAAAAAAAEGKAAGIEERLGMAKVVHGVSTRHPRRYALYGRVGDPVALLERLRPALSARLQRSHHARSSTTLVVSSYSSSLTLTIESGVVTGVEAGGPNQDPLAGGVAAPGIGVPPDLMATLLLGRYGAQELADRHPDVRLGRWSDLAEVLFPRLDADLVVSL